VADLTAYSHLLGAQVRSQSQYRASFVADVVGSLMFGVIDVASVIVVFRMTPTLGGFGFAEVFLMTALAGCAFATADLAVGNVERLRQYVRSGLFDALLVRPLSSLAQLVSRIRSRVNIGHGYSQEAPWPIVFALSRSARLTGMSSSGCSERRRRLPGSVAGLAPCC
jgi:ABC-type uncharacterized transport system permease subunit